MDRTTANGKVAALNFLMPYVQRLPNRLLRSEWATRIASELQVDEPVLRESLRRAALERRSEVKPKAELLTPAVKRAERQLIRMLFEADAFRRHLAQLMSTEGLHHGLETRNIFEALIVATLASESGARLDPAEVGKTLEDKDRRVMFEVLFEEFPEATWIEAESCLLFLRQRPVSAELADLQQRIAANPPAEDLKRMMQRRMELLRLLSSHRESEKRVEGD